MLFPCILAFALSLNGSCDFRFEEGKALEDAPDAGFAATDVIPVPACYDTMPKFVPFKKREPSRQGRPCTRSPKLFGD